MSDMRVVLAGGGRLAYFVGRALRDHGHQVVVVDADAADCASLARRLGVETRVGDPTTPEGLEDAAAGSADVVLAVTPDDARNLVVCQLARVRFAVPRVLSLVHDPENEPLFRALGVEAAISPTRVMASLIEQHAGLDAVIGLVPAAGGRVVLSEVRLDAGAPAVGRKLRDLGLPQGALVGCVVRDGDAFVPNGDSDLRAGDRVVVISVAAVNERAVKALAKNGS
jgi:trk system potassium uptake protein TrkA